MIYSILLSIQQVMIELFCLMPVLIGLGFYSRSQECKNSKLVQLVLLQTYQLIKIDIDNFLSDMGV